MFLTTATARQKPHRRTPSREGDDDEAPHAFLQNADARTSHADTHSLAMSESPTIHEDHDVPKAKPGSGLAEKAGIIIGIHNIFIVIPQFIISGISSIIFALIGGGGVEDHGPGDLATNGTINGTVVDLMSREGPAARAGGPDSYAYVFR